MMAMVDALLFDREPAPARPTITIQCTLGVGRGAPFPVKLTVDELESPTKLRPCNNGLCANKSCVAFANWSVDDIVATFRAATELTASHP